MSLSVVHEFLQNTEEGLILTLYLSRRSEVEFAADLGSFQNDADDQTIQAYIAEHHPQTPFNLIRVVTGEGKVVTLSYMCILSDAHHHSTGMQQNSNP
jgi:hypothetical protein